MTSAAGSLLEKYKNWLLSQPKFIRIVILPILVTCGGGYLQIFPNLSDSLKYLGGSFVLFFSVVVLYNSYLEKVTIEVFGNQIKQYEADFKSLKKTLSASMKLHDYFSELVIDKSEMWVKAAETALEGGYSIQIARHYVRDNNSIKTNIERIVSTIIFNAFDRFTEASRDECVRVAYFGPNRENSYLELKSSYNRKHETPKVERIPTDGRSLAAFVYNRQSSEPYFIHDVEKYVKDHGDGGQFVFFHGTQDCKVKSIFCFRIDDSKNHNCYGVLCIDSNTPNFFKEVVGEEICKQVVASAATRIIYETRFWLMKEGLGPYEESPDYA